MLSIGLALTFLIPTKRDWESWERTTLLIGVCFGFCSYIAQRKLFEHHAYAFVVFLCAWATIEFAKALKSPSWLHVIGLLCFSAIILWKIPVLNRRLGVVDASNLQTKAIMSDLERFGGQSLQHEVQCFDMVDGCFSALNRLGLMPYSTLIGDYMLFPPVGDPPLSWARVKMQAALAHRPPRVIVMTNMSLGPNPFSRNKVDRWPELTSYLKVHYTLEDSQAHGISAYRFYVLKDSLPEKR